MSILKWLRHHSAVASSVLLTIPFMCAQERSSAPGVVTRYCSGCHGIDGNSQLPYIPRLAGLSAAYSERKLASFRTATASPVDEVFTRILHAGSAHRAAGITTSASVHMVGVAHAISDQDVKAATQWYAAQLPARGKTGKERLVEEGKSLFADGRQAQGVPACQTCHGPGAQGTAIAPRLAGQNATYVVAQLALFRSGDARSSPVMTGIARNIGGDQARAVAVYLQSR